MNANTVKVGDWVVFKHPHIDTWGDIKMAIDSGWLRVGQKYEVFQICNPSGHPHNSIKVLVYDSKGNKLDWGLSADCFERLTTKRNLPEWF